MAEKYESTTGAFFDERGLLVPEEPEKLAKIANNTPPDKQEFSSPSEYNYIKPGKAPDVFGPDLTLTNLEVKDTGNPDVGRGLYARMRIEEGNPIFEFDGTKRGERKGLPNASDGYSSHGIVVGSDKNAPFYFVYAIPDDTSPLRYLNHSCNPNAARIPGDPFGFVALRIIEEGEEITADYSLLEANPYWKLERCGCGSQNCRGTIESVSSLPAPYLINNWDRLTPEMQLYAIEFSLDPRIAEIRNRLGATAYLERPYAKGTSFEQIVSSEQPTIIRERNRLGAALLAPVFLREVGGD